MGNATWASRVKRFTAFLLCLALTMLCVGPISAHADQGAQDAQKTVRVGWFDSAFHATDQFGRRSGYAYEYQQKIAAYSGWSYEYVTGSWPDLYQMLVDGQIDLLSDVSFTPERSELMLFSSQPMGAETYYVYIAPDGSSGISPEDPSTLGGKRVGVNKGSVQKDLFLDWAQDHHVQVDIVELTTEEDESVDMLLSGEIDAYVGLDSYGGFWGILPVCKVGSSDYYFAVGKSRPDLLVELDAAMSKIQDENRYYNEQLQGKYFDAVSSSLYLTSDEQDWLNDHGAIRVGYRDNYLAFCATDPETGELTGALKEYLDYASRSIGDGSLAFEPAAFPTTSDALEALKSGEVDCVFPVVLTPYDAEENGLLAVSTPIESEMYAVVRTSGRSAFSLNGEVAVAVNRGNPSYETFLMDNFPDWKRVYFDTSEDCLRGIAAGDADCILMSNYRIDRIAALMEQYDLSALSTGTDMVEYFAVGKGGGQLYSILNKATALVPASVVNAALTHYSFVEQEVTLAGFLRANALVVLAVLGLVLAAILTLLFRSRRSERETRSALARIEELNGELENSQETLRHALAASEQANRAKTSFLGTMSHEMRTPMNAIIGLDAIALDDPSLTPKAREYFEKIGASAQRLLALINDVLDVSRIESGRVTLASEEFSLCEMLEQVNSMIGAQCREKGLQYDCVTLGRIGERFVGDEEKLKQVLANILGNAVKFTDAPGRIAFTIEQVAVFEGQETLRFEIEDTGIGIDEDYLPRIFDAFTQEDEDATSQYGGTGLGLMIAKNIVDLMNGTISVQSVKGEGSTFTVQVTLQSGEREDPPASEQGEVRRAELKGRRVLMAEDTVINAEILGELLSLEEIDAEHAENGQLAVEMFDASEVGHFDAVLMDIRMPVLDGLGAARAIRALDRPDAKTVPIIAVTANALDEDVQRSLQAGMNAHLTKPVEPDRLYETLRMLIRE